MRSPYRCKQISHNGIEQLRTINSLTNKHREQVSWHPEILSFWNLSWRLLFKVHNNKLYIYQSIAHVKSFQMHGYTVSNCITMHLKALNMSYRLIQNLLSCTFKRSRQDKFQKGKTLYSTSFSMSGFDTISAGVKPKFQERQEKLKSH